MDGTVIVSLVFSGVCLISLMLLWVRTWNLENRIRYLEDKRMERLN